MKKPLLIFVVFLSALLANALPISVITKVDDLYRLGKTIKHGSSFYKVAGALSKSQIDELAEIVKTPNGLKQVGEILGKRGLSDAALSNAYLRIATKNGVITEEFAEAVFTKLSHVDGFRTLVRKINIANVNTAKGHLYELQIGKLATDKGFKVVSFGLKYSDDVKKADTDMDVLLSLGDRLFAVESKNYAGSVPMDMIRADAISLVNFAKGMKGTRETIPVFAFAKEPSYVAKKYLKWNDVHPVYGTPDEIITKIQHIAQCLN